VSSLAVAQQFATALDRDDYEAAGRVIYRDCAYAIDGETIIGRDAIVDSYLAVSDTGRAAFDSLEYDSSVSMDDDATAVIDFLDILIHNGTRHEHRCQQILTIEGGWITRIEHRDLPGERESLEAFKRDVGID